MTSYFNLLIQRLKEKLFALITVLLSAGVIILLFLGLAWIAQFILPDRANQFLDLLKSQNLEAIRQFFLSFDALSPFVFMGVQILQVFFAPLPGQLFGLLGGLVFGFWDGLLLTMLGLSIGSVLAIGLSRLLRETLVQRFVPPAIFNKFDYLIERGGLFNFFIIFLLPVFPDDAVCFIAGLTRLPLWQLLVVCLAGRLPGMAVLSFVGTSLNTDMTLAYIVFSIAMVISLIIWLFDREIMGYLKKDK
ncbi:hypothetical protein BegalDRAFT_2822 [Beggiatoa alba B18LD]|uniref:TVP38/TMEM64 family membrane protein n=1 Tax=Beggiatoa alba B18LD TaxID=395493 RepID=I3CJ63_9GAMM|nr:VTT domain-containing protein [Beggiatoa alba]EIJ43656.1 hypothetical protein BegalDRAFT_2822 [Beggiatoa alba B18LD]